MRFPALLLAVTLAAGPALSSASDERPRARRDRRAYIVAQATATAPAPAPPTRPAPQAAPARRSQPWVAPRAVAVVGLPFWWGWGLGWGYAPLYPRYPRPNDGYGPQESTPPLDPDRIFTRLSATGAGTSSGAAGGLSLAIEGRTAGFEAGVDALAIDGVTGVAGTTGSDNALGWGSAHATWSFVSEDAYRLRLEVGGSMLSMPATGAFAGTTWAGKVAFGPDVGVSGQLGLVGPIGVEGHARLTPFPVPVADTRLALALRGGPLTFSAGWRSIQVAGNGTDAPEVHFSGPELGLSLVF